MQSVFGMYALLIVASATHAWNYYELIGLTGNVSGGGGGHIISIMILQRCSAQIRAYLSVIGCYWYLARTTCYFGVCIEPFLVL